MSNRKISEDAKFMMEVKEAINTPEKWCKNVFHNQMEQRCLKGAIFKNDLSYLEAMVSKSRIVVNRVYWKIYKAAEKRVPWSMRCPIVTFNDAPETTHQDVMDLLDEVIRQEIGNE